MNRKYQCVVPYTSALPNKHSLKALVDHFPHWRWMLSPASIRSFGKNREHILYSHGYALDNGAYSFFKRDLPFPTDIFRKCVKEYGKNADWIVLPDVIGDWDATQKFSQSWYEELKNVNDLMIVAQNGCERKNFKELQKWIDRGCGVFIGGCDVFKREQSQKIVELCKLSNVISHVGRVNSMKRASWCNDIGAFSFDGSGMSRFTNQARYMSEHISRLHNQIPLFQDSYRFDVQTKYCFS